MVDEKGMRWPRPHVFPPLSSVLYCPVLSCLVLPCLVCPVTVSETFFQGDGGKHRALLIGINYTGQGKGELKGCHNDVAQMREYITTHVRSVGVEKNRLAWHMHMPLMPGVRPPFLLSSLPCVLALQLSCLLEVSLRGR